MMFIFALVFSTVHAMSLYPTVYDLQAQLHLEPGVQLPRDVQAENGSIYHVYYVDAHDHGEGIYTVTLKLKR